MLTKCDDSNEVTFDTEIRREGATREQQGVTQNQMIGVTSSNWMPTSGDSHVILERRREEGDYKTLCR